MIATPELHVVRAGPDSATPLLLLHSAALDLTYWDRLMEDLSVDHTVIAMDLPGHGLSAGGAQVWEEDLVLDTVVDAVDGLGVEALHVAGMSLGGTLAQGLALRRPGLVVSLTLIDTGARFDEPARAAMRARAELVRRSGLQEVLPGLIDHWFLPATRVARPDLMARVSLTLLRQDPATHAAMWDHIARTDLEDQIAAIACPTLVLVGEHDASSPLATARELLAIPDARLRVIPCAAHLSALEQPALTSRLIADHIARAV